MAKETAEYSISDGSKGISFSMGGGEDDLIQTNAGTIEMDTDDIPIDEEDDADTGADDGVDGEVDADDNADADGDSEETSDTELGEFDPEDPEVVVKFDAKYTTEDGALDAEGSLSAEYFANLEKGVDGLNEETYKYLEAKGISRATVKQIEAMAATNREAQTKSVEAQDLKLFELAGGPDQLAAALKWGKDGGYTKEQQERFNKVTKGKDLAAKEEAVEALMARYKRANPPQKPTLPKRDATKGQGKVTSDVKPYATRQEMREVRNALRDNDKKGWERHNRRLAISKFD
ncbi:hypothetical protein LZK73_21825 [Neorhizobium galegae]|nr:hypothetical protein LZK73_21825 [Neorhizobium galegae]